MNFFDHKNLGNHLLQLFPKVVKHPVYRCIIHIIPHTNLRYLHLDERTLYLAYLEDSECYAGGIVAIVRVSLPVQDEGERAHEERYPGLLGWGLRR